MSGNYNNQSSIKITYKGLGLAVGLILGGVFGLIIGELVIFSGGGMMVGLAIGTALDKRDKSNNS